MAVFCKLDDLARRFDLRLSTVCFWLYQSDQQEAGFVSSDDGQI